MAEFEFPDIYQWISHLPPPSLWSSVFHELQLSPANEIRLVAESTEDDCVSSFFLKSAGKDNRGFLGRVIKWSEEEDANTNMHLMTSPLLSFATACISHTIHHPNHIGCGRNFFSAIEAVVEGSLHNYPPVTQSSDYPRLFNSAFASMCILICPSLRRISSVYKFISPEILHPEVDILQPLIQPLTQILGSFFTEDKYSGSEKGWNPLNWSYAAKTSDSCELKICCPLLSMNTTHSHTCQLPAASCTYFMRALAYQQVECVIQLHYHLTFEGNRPRFHMGIGNVRCDVFPYENLLKGNDIVRDVASEERYFPSKICMRIGPQHGCRMIWVGQSSANPTYEIAVGRGWEVSYQAPKDVGVKASGTATSAMKINAWKFEQSAQGMEGTFEWTLCDCSDSNGKEVISSKPSKSMLYNPKSAWYRDSYHKALSPFTGKLYNSKSAWYRDRYHKASSPFTGKGGVVFASDNYGKPFIWTPNESRNSDESLKVRIEGSIWVTYWPNLRKTSFYESRYLHFSKLVELPLLPVNSK